MSGKTINYQFYTTPAAIPMITGQPGGHLQSFWRRWRMFGSKFALNVPRHGARLGFTTPPPKNKPIPNNYSPALAKEVLDLETKGAIEQVRKEDIHFFNPFFGLEQGTKLRPILNAATLNNYLTPPHYKMENIQTLAEIVEPGDWMVKLDVKDAYLQVPVAPEERKYLGFKWEDKFYQFKVLPFGTSTSPSLFCRLIKFPLRWLRQQGVRLVWYIDDLIILGKTETEARQHVRAVAHLLQHLGYLINWKKTSVESPRQQLEFLGTLVDTTAWTFSVPADKAKNIRRAISLLVHNPTAIPCRRLASVIGMIQATRWAFPPALMMTRFCQRILQTTIDKSGWTGTIPQLPTEARDELIWVHQNLTSFPTMIQSAPPSLTLTTDASKTGWGATLGELTTHGFWNSTESRQSSNWREMQAVICALSHFSAQVQNQSIVIRTDNMTTKWNLERQNSKSHELLLLVKVFWETCRRLDIFPHMRHIAGTLNETADALSRISERDEYRISDNMFRTIVRRLGPVEIDLFASRESARTTRYVSRTPDPAAMYCDAFSRSFPHKGGYSHPPPLLIGRVVRKFLADSCSDMILITPDRALPSLPLIRRLATQSLVIPHSEIIGSTNHRLAISHENLVAWKLCAHGSS